MMGTIAGATNGQGVIGNNPEVICAALAAAQAPELEAELAAEGRGASIHHGLVTQGSVHTRDFATWICLEKKCSRVRLGWIGCRVRVCVAKYATRNYCFYLLDFVQV